MRRFVSIVLVIGFLLFGSSLFEQQVYAQNSEDIVEAKHHLNVTDVSEDEYLNNISGIKELTGQELLKLVGSRTIIYCFLDTKSVLIVASFQNPLSLLNMRACCRSIMLM